MPGGAVATAGRDGVVATGRPSAVGPTPAAGLTRTTFLARFPLPPGAARSTLATDQHPVTGERFFLVRGALPDVRTFYAQRLPELGVSWSDLTPGTTRIDNGPEQIVSWWGRLSARTSPPIVGALRLDANYPGAPTGTVRIDLEVYP